MSVGPSMIPRVRSWLLCLALVVAVVFAASCATTPGASATAGTQPTSGTGGIELQRLAPNTACDSIGVGYRKVTIRIDPSSNPQVWAETDAGQQLAVRWGQLFTAEDGEPPVIRGPGGIEIARDGTEIQIPEGDFAELAGFFVCAGENSIGIHDTPPM